MISPPVAIATSGQLPIVADAPATARRHCAQMQAKDQQVAANYAFTQDAWVKVRGCLSARLGALIMGCSVKKI